jgi:hypothetical protein
MADLERLLDALATSPTDRPLDQLEPVVWRRIAARTGEPTFSLAAVRAGVVALALVGGAAAGTAAVSAEKPSNPLAVFEESSLACSHLLGD